MSLFAFPEITIDVITDHMKTLYTCMEAEEPWKWKGLKAFIMWGGHSGGSGGVHIQISLKVDFLPVKMSILTMQTFRVPISGGMLQTDDLVSYLRLGPSHPLHPPCFYLHMVNTPWLAPYHHSSASVYLLWMQTVCKNGEQGRGRSYTFMWCF